MSRFAPMPDPPYYAVIFSNQISDTPEVYAQMADTMAELAETIPGYIGRETARDADGFAVTVSYWETEAAIKQWREHAKLQLAQKLGKDRWYHHYSLRVAKIERQYQGP